MQLLQSKNNVHVNPIYDNYAYLNDVILFSDHYKQSKNDKMVNVDPDVAYRYQGNLYGLFNKLGIQASNHMLIMAYNDISSPHEYDGIRTVFYIPVVDIYSKLTALI